MASPLFVPRPGGASRSFTRTRPLRLIRSCPRAPFISLPTPPSPFSSPRPALLTASRQMPYPSEALYDIIADVDAYASFLPYCTHSRVKAWRTASVPTASATPGSSGGSGQASQQRRWPAVGDLTIGWGPFTESYSSRLYCIPGRVVEAVSGKGEPSITAAEAAQWGLDLERERVGGRDRASDIFETLITRWTVAPAKQQPAHGGSRQEPLTDVELTIRYQFVNPLYQVAMANVSDEVAGRMIKAFEQRAQELLGKTGGHKR